VTAPLAGPRPGASGFFERWLAWIGVPASEIGARAWRARARARRYPRPVGRLHFLLETLADAVAPALVLGRWARARDLSDEEFERLIDCLSGAASPLVRLAHLLLLAPLFEVWCDERHPGPVAHPLSVARPRAGPPRRAFDVIVVGSGAGGAAAAWSLARAGLAVAVLEQGRIVQPDVAPAIVERHYVNQGLVASARGGTALVLSGTAIGGATPINSGTCLRPRPDRLEAWDRELATTFAAGELEPWLALVESRIGVHRPDPSLLSKSAILFARGLAALGREGWYVLPRDAPSCTGAGRCCFGCPTGSKRGADRAFLPDAVAAGADLRAGSRAASIRETPRGVVVEYTGPDGAGQLYARGLVLAAGALLTPGLIRNNRLGSRWQDAGRHLKIHPAVKVLAHFEGLDHGEGGIPQGIGYRPPELPRVTMEGIHTPRSVLAPAIAVAGSRLRWWLQRAGDLASFGLMLSERATGTVRDIAGFPAVVGYSLHPDDAYEIGEGILLIARAFFEAGADRVLLPFAHPVNELKAPEQVRCLTPGWFTPDTLPVAGFHAQGTAGMGRVVDTDLRLMGSDRIWVADASVLPDSPGVNPMITIMALSLRMADGLASHLGGRKLAADAADRVLLP
jgi:choline dehydrogenase-like flavoprotein